MGLRLSDQIFFPWSAKVLKFSLTLMNLEAAHRCINWCPWDFTKWSSVRLLNRDVQNAEALKGAHSELLGRRRTATNRHSLVTADALEL